MGFIESSDTLRFSSNKLLIELCGQLDKNLSKIESWAGVQIIRRGNALSIYGAKDDCDLTRKLITDLYSELSYDELKDVLEGWLNPTAESTNEPASESTTLSESKKEVKNDLPFDVDESKPTPSKKTDDVASAFDDLFNN